MLGSGKGSFSEASSARAPFCQLPGKLSIVHRPGVRFLPLIGNAEGFIEMVGDDFQHESVVGEGLGTGLKSQYVKLVSGQRRKGSGT